jgi:uncharacterized protein YjbI with pentapeptide repeats
MAHSPIVPLVTGLVLFASAAPVMAAPPAPAVAAVVHAGAPVCNGKYKGHLKPSADELAEILKKHAAWLKDGGPDSDNPKLANDPRRANLCGADLKGVRLYLRYADLTGAYLEDADLESAELGGARLTGAYLNNVNLHNAHLNGAELAGVDLYGVRLDGAELNGAHLNGSILAAAHMEGASLFVAHLNDVNLDDAHLNGADLDEADLTAAYLTGADLTGAHLERAHLTGAHLNGAQVSKAKLAGVDLMGATYAPRSEPPDPYVAGIRGLATLSAASGEEIGLIQLRKLLKDAGLNDSAREATCSIQRNITRDQLSSKSPRSAQIEGCLRTVGLEWTTAYGLHPDRALRWILLLRAVLTPVYMFAMLRPTAASGVMQVFPADRLEGTAGDPTDEQKRKKQLVHAKGWRAAFRTAAYFSLISAVNIGFEDFTPGDWIRRLQTREYSLEAVGWVRVVAGAQALLSVYLLAMWVLTQFGQPFE